MDFLPLLGRSIALSGLAATTLFSQALPIPSSNARIRAALDSIKAQEKWTVDQQVSICEIPAPPYKEATRAAEYRRRLQSLGLANVIIDSIGNVIAERRGTGGGPSVLIEGHLDTVFPEGTDVKVKRNGTALAGPGIGDDCRGLAVVLSVARAFQRAHVQTAGTVYFVGDVGEEGQGNLRGTRYLFSNTLKGKIDYFISVDGTGLDLKHHGVGSKRYRVTYKGPGGHSYGAFGIPNPIHALGRAVAGIADARVPSSPKTTFNVGVISGGTSVNSIPFSATMDLDMRSETADALDALDKQVLKILGDALTAENDRWSKQTGARAERARLSLAIDTIGIRPANSTQTEASPIVATAIAAGRSLGFMPSAGVSGTDANLAMSLGVPAITIDGGGSGSGAHSLGERYDDGPSGWLGPQWAALIVAALAGAR